MPYDPTQLHAALSRLVGLPLWSSGYAGLQWFQFGDRRVVASQFGPKKGTLRTVGEYALHLECPWRVTSADGSEVEDVESWLRDRPYRVKAVAADATGGLRVTLEDGFVLEAMPETAADGELWRLFQPGRETPHFVAEGGELRED